METIPWIAAATLGMLLLAETWFPFFHQLTTTQERVAHDFRNLVVGILNSLLGSLALITIFVAVDRWIADNHFGLLQLLELPGWFKLALAVLLLDIWTYLWHRLNHIVPLLWRLHRTHHTDLAMDASTGVRFHMGEIFLSWTARLVILPLLGISLAQLATYESLLLPVVLFHHSNVRLPRWIDIGLLAVIVTPAMHRVHHSQRVEETNSNYGSLLPWWDVVFRSFKLRTDVENIRFGLEEFTASEWQTFQGIAQTPFAQRNKLDPQKSE